MTYEPQGVAAAKPQQLWHDDIVLLYGQISLLNLFDSLILLFFLANLWAQRERGKARRVTINSEEFFLTFSKIIETLTGEFGRLSGTRTNLNVTGRRIQTHHMYGSSLSCIDTSGFDESHRSDMEILEMISEWLVCMYANFLFCKQTI